ncbi:dethiobiotin synthase [Motilimonas pumila]|uniref:ATP-dependent dethiobiotin synthetase BioD n=1 Tax=Motilimonas pumila TaxID=2303987 RepID=A0A418YG59_9GAMM|nr:dethiobiotin synthase [Motilimonas pumila]RJG48457.1 dethiobiotin synthase [Motilimonas pumila]
MSQHLFIAGTDTDVGKTVVTQILMQGLIQQGHTVIGHKPIAAGAAMTARGLENDDALLIQQAASMSLPYEQVNPIVFAEPIAPHIAAAKYQQPISLAALDAGLSMLAQYNSDFTFVEGAGGWRLPLGDDGFLSDWVIAQKMPVILVVGMKLGCLNHAMLTAQAILDDGLPLVGWVANTPSDSQQDFYQENLAYLKQHIAAPMLAEIGYASDPLAQGVRSLDLLPITDFS